MSCYPPETCNDNQRRSELSAPGAPVKGIRAVEVFKTAPGDPLEQRVLVVYFFNNVLPAQMDNAHLQKFHVSGGVRVKDVRVQSVQAFADRLEITLDKYGDFSEYILEIDSTELDPIFRCRRFNFKVDCPNPFDCQPPDAPPGPLPVDPAIDYLAKDYRSFRRALLDFLTLRVPGFDETNEGDLAVTLAELFAYAGDQLSYYQDAVANEAYLHTARQRVSVKRHARLVDFRMHEGLAARTYLQFQVNPAVVVPQGWAVRTRETDPARAQVFETDSSAACEVEQNSIAIHTWRNKVCCLPQGATSIDLLGKLPTLGVGQFLIVEEILGPVSGATHLVPGAADPHRRQVVVITQIDHLLDPLQPMGQQDITRVTWDSADALRYEFCLQEVIIEGQPVAATVVRGNLVLASHGRTVVENNLAGLTLSQGPITWLAPWPSVDPAQGRAQARVDVNGTTWRQQESLLDAGSNDQVYVVDTDLQGRGILRFGDHGLGQPLPAPAVVDATYRVGNGVVGNVGSDSLVLPVTALGGMDSVRNPLPAWGGIDPQPIVEVRRDAPEAFRQVQYRAVTQADYAAAAASVDGIAAAVADFRWTGSWLTIFETLDPVGREGVPDTLRQTVLARLNSWRQAGYDLEVRDPEYVPLEIALTVCTRPDYFRGDVLRSVADALSSGYRLDGRPGFFHPDNFTFAQPLYLSQLYAAVQQVAGVMAVHATVFKRLNRIDYGELAAGVLKTGSREVLRLDNDRSLPDNGLLLLSAEGGK